MQAVPHEYLQDGGPCPYTSILITYPILHNGVLPMRSLNEEIIWKLESFKDLIGKEERQRFPH